MEPKRKQGALRVLVASKSSDRLEWYAQQLGIYGMDVATAEDALRCVEQLRILHPDVLLLEDSLPWGGADGVLAVRSEDAELQRIPAVLLDIDSVPRAYYRLPEYSLQGLLLRRPSGKSLASILFGASRNPPHADSEEFREDSPSF